MTFDTIWQYDNNNNDVIRCYDHKTLQVMFGSIDIFVAVDLDISYSLLLIPVWDKRSSIFLNIKYTRSIQRVSSYVIWIIETFIEEDTRYQKHCT